MTHEYSCDACAFQVRSEDDDEVIDLVRTHAMEQHDMEMSEQDVRTGLEEGAATG